MKEILSKLNQAFDHRVRLGIMSILMVNEWVEFNTLKEKTGATAGNLSVQIGKLQEAGYITVEKTYKNNYPLTICRIAGKGIEAFEAFYADLKTYYDGGKK